MSDIEKALAYFQGISRRDSALATRYFDPARYIEHNPYAGDGVDGVRQYVDRIAADNPELKVIRAYRDESYVVTQADAHIQGDGTFFDIFRFDDGLIVEHWAFSAQAGPPNQSGHTQVDGPTEPKLDADTEKNRSLVRDYYERVHIGGRHDEIPHYFSGDYCIRHEPGAADGVKQFMRDLEVLTRNRTIDDIKLLVAQADFVFIAAKGTHQSEPCAYLDLYRVEDGKIVEHWGFPEQIPPPDMRKNDNGML